MTNEPEWRIKLINAEAYKWENYGLRFNDDDYVSFIQDTIKEEKEKAKAELLSKIEEEVKGKLVKKAREIDYADRTEYDEAWEIVESSLSKYKV